MNDAAAYRVMAILDEVSGRLTEALGVLREGHALEDAATFEAGVLRLLARIHELRRHVEASVRRDAG